jgi:hypothetical protein
VGAIALHERREAVLRCAICHDEPLPLERCGLCQSAFHVDCRSALGRCPTLGCARRIRVSGRRPFAWRRNLILSLVTGGATFGFGLIVWRALLDATRHQDPTTEPWFKVAFTLFAILLSLHCVVLPCTWPCLASPRHSRASLVFRTLAAELSLGLCALFTTLVFGAVMGSAVVVWIVATVLFVLTPTVASYSVSVS